MFDSLRQHIAEIYDSSYWQPASALYWQGGTPWQLFSFEQDVEFEGSTYRCVIVEKQVLDCDDPSALDYAEDALFEAWEI